MNNYVTRIHLKTDESRRKEMIDFCLNGEEQCLAVGWSYVYEGGAISFSSFESYQGAVKSAVNRMPAVLNVFRLAQIDDLFWTRDLDGVYWICRVKGLAEAYYHSVDIGAILPVEAYPVGLQVPGQIKASFNRARGGTSQRIWDKAIIEYSKAMFNQKSDKNYYKIEEYQGNIIDNLPDFDLEELVISYLQIKKDLYVLSNSIANKSTTIKIECELMSRNLGNPRKAVVQVKGKKAQALNANDYQNYISDGYDVYLYAPKIVNAEKMEHLHIISQEELLDFYGEYKSLLPHSIKQWERLY